MTPTTRALRRGLPVVFAATAAGGAVVAGLTMSSGPLTPSATAAADPCAASEVAKTIGSVATSIGDYLDEHPQTNQALTTISQQQAGPQSLGAVKAYFDANPKAAKEMQQLQQPGLVVLRQLLQDRPQRLLLQGQRWLAAPAGCSACWPALAAAELLGLRCRRLHEAGPAAAAGDWL